VRAVRTAIAILVLAAACQPNAGPPPSERPSEDPACPAGPVFTALPVPAEQVDQVFGIGTFGAPGHVIPNEHGGIWVTGQGVPFMAPGAGRITTLRRTKYVASTFRPGELDHAISFRPCAGQESVFGHVTALSPDLDALVTGGECHTYSTDMETVEACVVRVSVPVTAGQVLGKVGGESARGFDWGHHVDAHVNHFANPARVTPDTLHAACPYDGYEGALRDTLFSKIQRDGEPRCGTVALDVDGTAQGLWVDKSAQGTQAGDERAFVTLGPQYDTPDVKQRLALAPSSLGGMQVDVPIAHSGRINRAFAEVTADGAVHCYGSEYVDADFFLALLPNGALHVERVARASGTAPCLGDPSAWSVSASAVVLVR